MYYDASYDRTLSPPAQTTPVGIPGGNCPGQVGTQVGFDESIDVDLTKIDGGGGINLNYLPRDPKKGCAVVYPHNYLRVNTIFELVKAGGGYTAWTDKHRAYEITSGPSGSGVDDLYGPEINSNIALLNTPGYTVPSCSTSLPDPAAGSDWTSSFQNIQCYDQLHTQAIINQIDGKTHDGSAAAPVPTLFGANFQAVSIGQKLHEESNGVTGGYLDALGTPSTALNSEFQFIDAQIGKIVAELTNRGLLNSTLFILSAKHGQSAIDPNRIQRIPFDLPGDQSPATLLGSIVAQSIEDDESLIWLRDQTQTSSAVSLLEANESFIGAGEIFAGPSLNLMFPDPLKDSRTPDIIVTPNYGVTYTGKNKKIAEHGGFSHDDTNVALLVSNPALAATTVNQPVQTAQIAPTILKALGLNPGNLKGVQMEGAAVLPGLPKF